MLAASTCWRCIRPSARLARPLLVHPSPLLRNGPAIAISIAALSTTPVRSAGVKAVKPQRSDKPQRQTLKIKKTDTDQPKKAPFEPGERKALRQQVILKSNNAKAVTLPKLSHADMVSPNAVGTVFALPDNGLIEKLRTVGAFKTNQHWPLFNNPSIVLRQESLALGILMKDIQDFVEPSADMAKELERAAAVGGEKALAEAKSSRPKKSKRVIIDGPSGSGKTNMLLQAMIWALESNWLVINIPNAVELVNGTTEYDYDAATKLWAQREYMRKLLQTTMEVNKEAFDGIKLTADRKVGTHTFRAHDSYLKQLCQFGIKDSTFSYEAFNVMFDELSCTNAHRPPVLLALDNLNEIMLPSDYRDADFNVIHAHDLAVPATFLSFLSGGKAFPRGLTIAATTTASRKAEALQHALLPKVERQAQEERLVYSNLDRRVEPMVKKAGVMRLEGLDVEETRAFVDYCRKSGFGGDIKGGEWIARLMAVSSGRPREILREVQRLR